MKVNGVWCSKCNSFIFSRCRHDFRWCICEEIFIDGGFDYTKVGGNIDKIEQVDIQDLYVEFIDYTNKEILQVLYNDWNIKTDFYGLIRNYKK